MSDADMYSMSLSQINWPKLLGLTASSALAKWTLYLNLDTMAASPTNYIGTKEVANLHIGPFTDANSLSAHDFPPLGM